MPICRKSHNQKKLQRNFITSATHQKHDELAAAPGSVAHQQPGTLIVCLPLQHFYVPMHCNLESLGGHCLHEFEQVFVLFDRSV
jgi:hypothetical protein